MKEKLQKWAGVVTRFVKKHRKLTIVLVIVLVAGVLALVFLKPSDPRSQTAAPAVTVLKKTMLEQLTTVTGTVSSAASRSVNAKTSASVTEILVAEGDSVTAGQVLARLDTSDLQKSIKDARSDVAEAEAATSRNTAWAQEDLTTAQNSFNAANDALNAANQAYAAAQTACETDPSLCSAAQENYQTFKNAEQSKSQAESALRQAQRQYENQTASDSAKTARRQLEQLQSQLKDYVITTPVAGVVTEMNAAVGQSAGGGSSSASVSGSATATAGQSATSSSALFVIEDVGSFKAELAVAEYDAMEIAIGNSARITADAIDGKTWDAKVTAVSPKVIDGNFTVTLAILSAVQNLKIGMSISADIITGVADDVFVVPYDAVVKNEKGDTVVYSVTMADALGGRPSGLTSERVEIPVVTGLETDYYIAISGGGLTAGAMILNDPNGVSVTENSNSNNMFNMGGGRMPSGGGFGPTGGSRGL
ncbi:MAG: efflux RND transporter periplasmic adaptor subunit [Candidatus Nomurabacteria bacterium]|jgi:multidrug efflux pump subunit AcrA (membrane-fusion protein)|nr:efflux RND transporter periplasmic adaptor subunit [Candidatus Nomurabacteria bacterium]